MERRFFIVLQYLLDTGLHSNVLWGLNSLKLVFVDEYPEFNSSMIALLFTISMSVSGFWIVFVGWLGLKSDKFSLLVRLD